MKMPWISLSLVIMSLPLTTKFLEAPVPLSAHIWMKSLWE